MGNSPQRNINDLPWRSSWEWVGLPVIILFVTVVRARLLTIPLERDEGEFAYMGQLILQGIPPYHEAYSMKMPGIYVAYAVIMALFGQSVPAIHLGLLLVNLATLLALFFLVKVIIDSFTALIAAGSYAILSLSPSVNGLAGHATQFVALFALVGTLLLLRALKTGHRMTFLYSGLLFGIAFLMKQPGIFFMFFAVSYFAVKQWKRDDRRPMAVVKNGAMLFGGFIAPIIVTLLALASTGVFEKFWFWTVKYAAKYGSLNSFDAGKELFLLYFSRIVSASPWLWLAAGIGFFIMLFERGKKYDVLFPILFFIFSFISVCPGFYFRGHYFVLLLPSIAIVIGIAVRSASRGLEQIRLPQLSVVLPIAVFVLFSGMSIFQQRFLFFASTPVQASRMIYSVNPFPESLEIAQHIRDSTTETDRIAVIGSEPQIYFYAKRHSATGYIYMYPLMEPQEYASQMQSEMISEIQNGHPKFLVFVNIYTSWGVRPESERTIFNWYQAFTPQNYTLDGIIDIVSREQTVVKWGSDVRQYSPRSSNYLLVYKRKG